METFIQQLTAETPYAFHVWYGLQPTETSPVWSPYIEACKENDHRKEDKKDSDRQEESVSEKDNSDTKSEEQHEMDTVAEIEKGDESLGVDESCSEKDGSDTIIEEELNDTDSDPDWETEEEEWDSDHDAEWDLVMESRSKMDSKHTKNELKIDTDFLFMWDDDEFDRPAPLTLSHDTSPLQDFELIDYLLYSLRFVIVAVVVLINLEAFPLKQDEKEG